MAARRHVRRARRAVDHEVFRIHNDQLQTHLGLERRRGYRYAFNEFRASACPRSRSMPSTSSRLEPEERDVFDERSCWSSSGA